MGRLEQLITFISVAEEQSFARAARGFKLSPAAVTKQIASLEEELGTRLFERTTRKIFLTEAGTLLFEHAKPLIQQGKELEGLFSQLRQKPSGHLRIGSSWYFAEMVLLPHLEAFFNSAPLITLELLHIEHVPDLARDKIDLNMGHTFVGGIDDVHRRLGDTCYAYCASKEYLSRWGTPKKPEELVHHRYLTHCMRNPDNLLEFDKGQRVIVEPHIRFNDSRLMVKAAIEGLGIIKLHRYAIQKSLEKGSLIEILKGFDHQKQPIYLCYRQQKFVPPKIRHFIDFFTSRVKKEIF